MLDAKKKKLKYNIKKRKKNKRKDKQEKTKHDRKNRRINCINRRTDVSSQIRLKTSLSVLIFFKKIKKKEKTK